MTSFKTQSFDFFKFNPDIIKHHEFLQKLLNDEHIQAYLKDIETFILEEDTNNIYDNAYLVGLNDNIVGYLALFNYSKIIEFHYAVEPSFRGIRNNSNETIGCRIVKEASSYLFTINKKIDLIRLFIDEENIESIKMAKRAGFTLTDTCGYYQEYIKHR